MSETEKLPPLKKGQHYAKISHSLSTCPWCNGENTSIHAFSVAYCIECNNYWIYKPRYLRQDRGEIWRSLFNVNRLNMVHELIIDEVNEHQHFIASWKRHSFKTLCGIDRMSGGGLSIK